jgi:2-oxoglutarate ferredoxin oxidoreductase subunit beta
VTFNNHDASTKSYDWGREHEHPIHEIGFVNAWDSPDVEYTDGSRLEVPLPDGGRIYLRKLAADHDPRDKDAALRLVNKARKEREFLTGLFYLNTTQPNFVEGMHMVEEPLATLPESATRPPKGVLDEVMASFR